MLIASILEKTLLIAFTCVKQVLIALFFYRFEEKVSY